MTTFYFVKDENNSTYFVMFPRPKHTILGSYSMFDTNLDRLPHTLLINLKFKNVDTCISCIDNFYKECKVSKKTNVLLLCIPFDSFILKRVNELFMSYYNINHDTCLGHITTILENIESNSFQDIELQEEEEEKYRHVHPIQNHNGQSVYWTNLNYTVGGRFEGRIASVSYEENKKHWNDTFDLSTNYRYTIDESGQYLNIKSDSSENVIKMTIIDDEDEKDEMKKGACDYLFLDIQPSDTTPDFLVEKATVCQTILFHDCLEFGDCKMLKVKGQNITLYGNDTKYTSKIQNEGDEICHILSENDEPRIDFIKLEPESLLKIFDVYFLNTGQKEKLMSNEKLELKAKFENENTKQEKGDRTIEIDDSNIIKIKQDMHTFQNDDELIVWFSTPKKATLNTVSAHEFSWFVKNTRDLDATDMRILLKFMEKKKWLTNPYALSTCTSAMNDTVNFIDSTEQEIFDNAMFSQLLPKELYTEKINSEILFSIPPYTYYPVEDGLVQKMFIPSTTKNTYFEVDVQLDVPDTKKKIESSSDKTYYREDDLRKQFKKQFGDLTFVNMDAKYTGFRSNVKDKLDKTGDSRSAFLLSYYVYIPLYDGDQTYKKSSFPEIEKVDDNNLRFIYSLNSLNLDCFRSFRIAFNGKYVTLKLLLKDNENCLAESYAGICESVESEDDKSVYITLPVKDVKLVSKQVYKTVEKENAENQKNEKKEGQKNFIIDYRWCIAHLKRYVNEKDAFEEEEEEKIKFYINITEGSAGNGKISANFYEFRFEKEYAFNVPVVGKTEITKHNNTVNNAATTITGPQTRAQSSAQDTMPYIMKYCKVNKGNLKIDVCTTTDEVKDSDYYYIQNFNEKFVRFEKDVELGVEGAEYIDFNAKWCFMNDRIVPFEEAGMIVKKLRELIEYSDTNETSNDSMQEMINEIIPYWRKIRPQCLIIAFNITLIIDTLMQELEEMKSMKTGEPLWEKITKDTHLIYNSTYYRNMRASPKIQNRAYALNLVEQYLQKEEEIFKIEIQSEDKPKSTLFREYIPFRSNIWEENDTEEEGQEYTNITDKIVETFKLETDNLLKKMRKATQRDYIQLGLVNFRKKYYFYSEGKKYQSQMPPYKIALAEVTEIPEGAQIQTITNKVTKQEDNLFVTEITEQDIDNDISYVQYEPEDGGEKKVYRIYTEKELIELTKFKEWNERKNKYVNLDNDKLLQAKDKYFVFRKTLETFQKLYARFNEILIENKPKNLQQESYIFELREKNMRNSLITAVCCKSEVMYENSKLPHSWNMIACKYKSNSNFNGMITFDKSFNNEFGEIKTMKVNCATVEDVVFSMLTELCKFNKFDVFVYHPLKHQLTSKSNLSLETDSLFVNVFRCFRFDATNIKVTDDFLSVPILNSDDIMYFKIVQANIVKAEGLEIEEFDDFTAFLNSDSVSARFVKLKDITIDCCYISTLSIAAIQENKPCSKQVLKVNEDVKDSTNDEDMNVWIKLIKE